MSEKVRILNEVYMYVMAGGEFPEKCRMCAAYHTAPGITKRTRSECVLSQRVSPCRQVAQSNQEGQLYTYGSSKVSHCSFLSKPF